MLLVFLLSNGKETLGSIK